jgi:2-methylcitrate dehydratase PrpD
MKNSGKEPTLVQQLAHFAAETTFDSLPAEVVHSIKQRMLDTVGICLAATYEQLGDGVGELVATWGGKPEASLIAGKGQYPAPNAALYNGTLAHSLDFDDTHLPSVLHPSATIIPAMLALGEALGVAGSDMIAAAAAAYEINVRLGMAAYDRELGNSIFFEKGWHATSICGTLATAAIGARLLGLGADGIAHAMGIATSMGSGVIEANRSGGSVKRLHCGWAAHSGLTAALLAERGYTGPPTALEGRFGFYTAFCDRRFNPSEIVDQLGIEWVTPTIFFKPYPTNHFTHAAIDAALIVKDKTGIEPDMIKAIHLGTATAPLRTISQPREQKVRPLSGYHAKFSGPFTVASALLGGGGLGVYFDDFTDETVQDPAHLELAAKVQTFVDSECENVFPSQFPAVLRVELHSGEVLEERVMANRGGPDNPLSDEELYLKFKLNAEHRLSTPQVEKLADAIMSLDKHRDVVAVVALMNT